MLIADGLMDESGGTQQTFYYDGYQDEHPPNVQTISFMDLPMWVYYDQEG